MRALLGTFAVVVIGCSLWAGIIIVRTATEYAEPRGAGIVAARGQQVSARAPTDGTSPEQTGPGSGLFVEQEGTSEQPVVRVTNLQQCIMTLRLAGEDGRVYSVVSTGGRTATVKVAPGHYGLYITCTDPHVMPTYGDATFRRCKEYTADLLHAPDTGEPLHLGD